MTTSKTAKAKTTSTRKGKKTMKKQFVKKDVYQDVTNRIVAALEEAKKDSKKLPWLRPWKNSNTGASMGMPHNAKTGRAYSGINVMLLWCDGARFNSNGWLTFNQVKELGGKIEKGQSATQIVFFKPLEITQGEGEDEKKVKIPMLKYFNVWNVEECNLPEESLSKIHSAESIPEFEGTSVSEICKTVGAKVDLGGNRACFIPSHDLIQMPHLDQFKSEDEFESTLAHELTHWTGGKARLARDMSGRFGDEGYAFEELVAELGSAFLCAQLGIEKESMQANHESYIQGWIEKLQEDKKAIFGASSLARQANEFILQECAA